jgi:MYXO-CTERM domain-containing protein
MEHRLSARIAALAAGALMVGLVFLLRSPAAHACGCFTPPDPSVPIVQAGERIAFQIADGKVTAHIQIQYSGPAEEFGWLLPLPSLPELEVGTDELFNQLIQQTQPLYRLTAEYEGDCWFDPSRGGGGDDGGDSASGDGGAPPGEDGESPLVLRDSIGPYDFAVLRADEQQPMLDWLDENGFFVPAGTDEAVVPYIRPGAYFLALKLLKGNDVGDIQPVVVEYASDLPMIPIVLTSVAADPDMPVLVWVLGESRAIPRNFFHTKINDGQIDWLNAGANYIDVITRAVDEADGHHSFVTEYADSTLIMRDLLDYPGRFGDLNELGATFEAVSYVEYMSFNGFPTGGNAPPFFTPAFTSQTLAILQKHLPVPARLLEELTDQGQGANGYYQNMRYFVENDRLNRPDFYTDLDLDFDPAELTAELTERVVEPTLAAGALFRENKYMTRLFTTMSPDEMSKDPVFSFNPDLPDVSNVHEGRLIYYCGIIAEDSPTTTPAKIITEDGWELGLPDGPGQNPWLIDTWPQSRFIEVVREEGAADAVVDNSEAIALFIASRERDVGFQETGGCSLGGSGAAGGLGLAALALLLMRRRRSSGRRE